MLSSSRVIGLKDVFGNTSDPRYFVEFETQARTLQLLSGPVEEALNIRLLVGEPGVGKTALLLRLLQQVHSTVLKTINQRTGTKFLLRTSSDGRYR
ncbi:MAG: hypothetical protein DMG93_12195 [Acidobacteria bacterium]|nr:MAG: hypothetical protein DMG93_12195 [Acidobacteriota bacterium]